MRLCIKPRPRVSRTGLDVRSLVNGGLLSEVGFQQCALLPFEAPDRFLLDLAHTFASEVKFGSDLLECHLLAAYAEEHLEDLALTLVKLAQRTVNLFRERLLCERGVSHGRIIIGQHIEQVVVLAFHKWRIY